MFKDNNNDDDDNYLFAYLDKDVEDAKKDIEDGKGLSMNVAISMLVKKMYCRVVHLIRIWLLKQSLLV